MRNSSGTCIFPSHCDQFSHGPEKRLFSSLFFPAVFQETQEVSSSTEMQSGWISKNKGFVSTSSLAAICILLSLLFFSSSQGIFLFTLAFLILIKNCGLMMMIMMRFQIFKSTVVLFQKAGANPFLQTLNKRDSSRFKFLNAFLLLLMTLRSLWKMCCLQVQKLLRIRNFT